ncbi:tripartite ATP-independent transporter DctP family solute receptor [Bradyrhizobium sp. JR7.2]|jgi:TRAP-type transport system periplasmic protein|uniref:TRAP transporter substrate-binding protein n=1 Tax=Bradyrhizobium barranii TaxID=2992140 RepID=A0ABY3R0I9_9BRAD|nr:MULTISPECIES: TRAP transporter substrate-binding protein [Bradyrhizobium]UFW91475.1 TRAP transporter substrate-binding protein [Bradyrhizobium japonicum]WFT96238.1 TRAP transporter substrate-binding protein [Bradyrhizobium barranii]
MHRQVLGLWKAGSIVAAAAGLLVLQSAAASPRLISLAFNSQLGSPQQIGADEFRQKLVASAGKRIVIDERATNALGSENAILAATRAGSVDMAVLSGSVVSSVVPELGVFDIPFLFRDTAHAKAVAQGPAGAAIATKFADKGLTLLAIGRQGFRNVTNSKRPVRSPEDIKGLKIRVIPNEIYQMTFKALGAEVVPMEFPLVYTALKDGRLDGQENPVPTIAGSRLYEVQKYLTLTGHFFAPIAFVANRAMFEQLPPADQAMLIALAKEGAEATWQAKLDAASLEQVRSGGMDVIETFDRQPFVDAVKPLDQEFEKRFGKDLLAAIRSTR